MARSGELAVALVDAVDESLLVRGEIMTTTIGESIERSSPRKRKQIPMKIETCQQTLWELPSACARVDNGKFLVRNVLGIFAVNYAEEEKRGG